MRHGTGIFSYVYHEFSANVPDYTSPMENMGNVKLNLNSHGPTV